MERITNYLQNLIKTKNLPYLEVLATKDGKTVYSNRFFKDKTYEHNGLCFMFSMSKPITIVAGLKLVEQGLIKFSDKVYKFLPFVKECYYIENGKKINAGEDLTVFNLFTMTSGLDYNLETPEIVEAFNKNPDIDTISALKIKLSNPLQFKPGARYNYSLSHDLLGAVIESVSKKRFADFVKDEIFAPLGMNNSTFNYVESGVSNVYIMKNGNPTTYNIEHLWVNSKNYHSGGGGLKSTASDYVIFAKTLANNGVCENGYRLLNENSINLLKTPLISNDLGFNCVHGNLYEYGYGVRVRIKDTAWGLKKGEFGWDGAAGSFLLVDTENNVSVVVGMNLVEWPNVLEGAHMKICEKIYKEIL